MDIELIEKIISNLQNSGKILSKKEIDVIRDILKEVGDEKILNDDELILLREVINDYFSNNEFKEILNFLTKEFRNPEDRELVKALFSNYKLAIGIFKFLIWFRNIAIAGIFFFGVWSLITQGFWGKLFKSSGIDGGL